MRRRKHHSRPPTSSGYKSGQVLTFATSGDAPHPSELVKLMPVGPAPLELGFQLEDDRVCSTSTINSAPPTRDTAAPRAVQTLEEAYILEYLQSGPKMHWKIRRYLFLMDSEIGSSATDDILKVLEEGGLVEGGPKSGEFQLAVRDKCTSGRTPISA